MGALTTFEALAGCGSLTDTSGESSEADLPRTRFCLTYMGTPVGFNHSQLQQVRLL